MGTFSKNLDLRWEMEDGVVVWTLLSPFYYISDDGAVYAVPEGFRTDLASIPQVFWSVLPPFWRYSKAAVIHDWILSELHNTELANEVFKEAMVSLNVNKQQIFIIYNGVRIHFWCKRAVTKLKKI